MQRHANYKVEQIVEYIRERLDCSQKLIASYIGLNESTISGNLDKHLEEVVTKKTGKRLFALYLAVHQIEDQTSEAIKEALNEFVYEDLDGNMDSAISAIQAEKYQPNVVANIAKIGLEKYRARLAARGNGLYEAVRMAVASSN